MTNIPQAWWCAPRLASGRSLSSAGDLQDIHIRRRWADNGISRRPILLREAGELQSLSEFWAAVTPPQATIISGGLTLLAAVGGILLGWWLFSGRVKDLKGALDASDKLLADHSANVATALLNITERVTGLDTQFTTTLESLGQLRGNVSDLQSVAASRAERTGAIRLSRGTRQLRPKNYGRLGRNSRPVGATRRQSRC